MESKTTVIIGAIVLFLAGFFIGQLTGGGIRKGGASTQVVMADGKTLDVRLNEMDDKLGSVKKNMDELMARINKQPQRQPGPDPAKLVNFDLSDRTPKGKAGAKVTIVEWSDFQCPYCQRMANNLDELAKQYPNDVKIYFKNRPLNSIHPFAQPAAEAAEAARQQGKFWEMYEVIFKNRAALDQASLEKYAQEAGLDMSKYKQGTQSGAFKASVDKDSAEADKLGINSTPTVFINGYYVANPSPDEIKAKIEEALKK
jgi:protein-disulfide isomerase